MTTLPPGFRESSWRQAFSFGSDPYGFLLDGRRRFGNTFTMHLPGDPPRVVLAAPDDVKRVFALAPDDYRSDTQSLHLNLGSNSVLFADGERHQRRRRLLTQPLQGAALRGYAAAIQRITDHHLDGLVPGSTVNGAGLMQEITLDIILECIFGKPAATEAGARLKSTLLRWLEPVLSPSMFITSLALSATRLRRILDRATLRSLEHGSRRLWAGPWRKVGDAKAELLRLLRNDVESFRASSDEGRRDVLAALVQARDDDGQPFEDDDIVDQLVTLLVGGHETTANTLTWVLHHLLVTPTALERCRSEIRGVPNGEPCDPRSASELPWLQACMTEAMRLTPIAPAFSRTLTRPQRFGDWTVPEGTIVWGCIVLVQRDESLWREPDKYDPERFLTHASPRPEQYFPFGGGRRRCIGAAFADFEMSIVLARIIDRCDLKALAPAARPTIRGFTVVPSGGVPVEVIAVH